MRLASHAIDGVAHLFNGVPDKVLQNGNVVIALIDYLAQRVAPFDEYAIVSLAFRQSLLPCQRHLPLLV